MHIFRRRFLLVTSGIVALGVVSALRAQAPATDTNPPAFEVASVRPNRSGANANSIGLQPGGGFRAINAPLRALIAVAYGTPRPLFDFQISGGPKWIESDRFDIVAKAAGGPQPGPDGPTRENLMLRSLLAERFQLAVHRQTKELPIYRLVIARTDGKFGAQLRPVATDCAAFRSAMLARGGPPPSPAPGERMPCAVRMFPGRLSGDASTIAQLTDMLARLVNRTIVDRTGLTGPFDFDLQWTPDQLTQGRGEPPLGAPPLAIDPNGPSIFTAVQEQLGLKLESTKGPVDVLVIDHVEHLTPD
jgi:bla regulator protein BlaR1